MKCVFCRKKITGIPYGEDVKYLLEMKVITKKKFSELKSDGLVEDGLVNICRPCFNDILSKINKKKFLKQIPTKVFNHFYPQKMNEILVVKSKILTVQPIVPLIFLLGIFLMYLIITNFLGDQYVKIVFSMIILPIFYFFLWLMWTICSLDTYIGNNGILLEIRAVSTWGQTTVYRFVSIPFNKIKKYYSIKDGIRFIVNKKGIINTIIHIDIFVKKNSSDYKALKKLIQKNNISEYKI